jgi:hypothetical protein
MAEDLVKDHAGGAPRQDRGPDVGFLDRAVLSAISSLAMA